MTAPIENKMTGKFKKFSHYAFFIPDNRASYGGDFFVNSHNFGGAVEGDRVEAVELAKSKGKKPEAKIVHVVGTPRLKEVTDEEIVGIYTGGGDVFGFIDIEGRERGYFVHERNKLGAQDGDKVRAVIRIHRGKEEAVIRELLPMEKVLVSGTYTDKVQYGFVTPSEGGVDIFIAGGRKNGAKTGNKVEVQILRKGVKKPEGKIVNIISTK